jgi:hypothetical protein
MSTLDLLFLRNFFPGCLLRQLALDLSYRAENIVSLAYFWLILEPSTYCSEYVVSVEVPTIGNIVDGNAGMHKHAHSVGPIPVIS